MRRAGVTDRMERTQRAKPPLYRKVNTTAHSIRHGAGGDFHEQRNSKAAARSDAVRLPMHGKARRGFDYTPLFRFLLSKVGTDWNEVHAEAVARLDRADPVFWLVARQAHEEQDVVRVGESSYFSGLRVDEHGRLQRVNPSLDRADMTPLCGCCTHTFNGQRFTQAFKAPA
jgi:hypothetical protein